ncbi:MAG TPA: response regulator transcription factor [Saprospiraceae bacterium]|nr:response regulator transcription factor [Saprospiraceae bacterium]
MQLIRLAIADDHRVLIEGLKALFSDPRYGCTVVLTVSNGEELLHGLGRVHADMILLDLNMRGGNGLVFLPRIREAYGDIKVIIFTMYDQPKFIKEAFKHGAEGYILKDSSFSDLVLGIQKVAEGHVFLSRGLSVYPGANGVENNAFEDEFLMLHSLTKRELEILALIAQAKTNKEIADQLYISDQTVSVHRKNLMRKLNISNSAGLMKFVVDNDLLSQ